MDGISGQKFSLPQPKKVDTRKKNEVMSQGDERAKGGTEDKKDTGFPQIKYCPPERDDNLNISKEGLNLIKDKDKKFDVTLEEIREKILNRPEKETPFEKIEEFLSGLEGLDKDEKIDFPSIQEGTPEEMEISRDVFRNLSEIGERRKKDLSERGIYMRPDADKDEVSDLWMYDGSAPVSVPLSKEKTPEETDRERLHDESHKIMEKLGGKDSCEEEIDNVMGGKTYKKYGIIKDGKDIAFQEGHISYYEDKDGNPKKDSSVSAITRHEDGSYSKYYGRYDSNGNKYTTKLITNQDGSSERTSETTLKDGTKINSTETKDKDGMRKIVSEEVRPDGTKIYKEKTIDKDGKGKVVIKKTKGDGRTVSKERETGNVPAEVSDGDEIYTGTGGNIPLEAGDGNGYPAGIGGNFGGELKPTNSAGGEVKGTGGSSANIPSDLNGAYSYFDKYFPEEAEDMKEMSRQGKLNILTQEEAEEILPKFGEMGKDETGSFPGGGVMPSGSGEGIINMKLRTDMSAKEIAANMRHEYWHMKFDDYSNIKWSDINGPAGGFIRGIQETFCYEKELEAKEKAGLEPGKSKKNYDECKNRFEQFEKYLDLREKWETKEIDTIPKEYEGIHKVYDALTPEQKKLIDEQLDFYYENI